MNNDDKIQSKSLENTGEMDFYDKIADKPLLCDEYPADMDSPSGDDIGYPQYNFDDIIRIQPNKKHTIQSERVKQSENRNREDNVVEDITDYVYKVHTYYSKFQKYLYKYTDSVLGSKQMEMVESNYFKIHTDIVTPQVLSKLEKLECMWYITSEKFSYSDEILNVCIHIKWEYASGEL